MQLVLALGLYLTATWLADVYIISLSFILTAALVYTPALWFMGGLAVFMQGALPKYTGVVWGYFGYACLIVFIGRMGVLPAWTVYTTPFGFIPELPMDAVDFAAVVNMLILAALAVGLVVAGLNRFTKRDIGAV